MRTCPICGNAVSKPDEDAYFLFSSTKTGQDEFCCDQCEKQMEILLNAQEPSALKKAINYFYTYLEEIEDSQTHYFLKEIIESNAEIVNDLSSKNAKQPPIEGRQKDYFANNNSASNNANSTSSEWITGLRTAGWICFFGIIIVGISIAILNGNFFFGILIILSFIVLAFLTVASLMIFLDMAEDCVCQ